MDPSQQGTHMTQLTMLQGMQILLFSPLNHFLGEVWIHRFIHQSISVEWGRGGAQTTNGQTLVQGVLGFRSLQEACYISQHYDSTVDFVHGVRSHIYRYARVVSKTCPWYWYCNVLQYMIGVDSSQ